MATRLIQSVGVLSTFAYLGIAYLIVTVVTGFLMQNPPDGWKPEGWTPTATETSHRAGHDFTLSEAVKTWQWYALWLLLFLNTCAGISIISQEAPLFQELTGVTAVVAASMGRIGEYWQRSRASVLGMDLRFDHQARYFLVDVR